MSLLPLLLLPALVHTAPAPPPAPAASPSPENREASFPGFNGFPLKGSVRAAQGHGYFAVLMAGSGPTDRDWSNPLIRDPRTGQRLPSHGGRDLAAWLASQGLGSLRWDKRFIGSKDPKLDISLDAQVGDLKAALAFARTLPEAKGKKLLLVGHSEGALLSLLAAQGADALLLLGLPGQTMARTIEAQVRAQLPPEQAPANLAYLASVLQAVREDKPQPTGSPQVFPGLVMLGRSLMQPESLSFVKATLDLDPWPLAARVTVPLAAAWGDKDVQTPKPDAIPPTFPGTVIDLKDANHLLKKEPRPRVDLSALNATEAYSDETPQADLTPLATWLKQIN
ncbi:MAG: Alpha/beta hydrolase family protein [Acidobacteria bacterium ADurb.Bin340]|nr:MAG: Alpha/beta hydrolase family protein [Acidobacteria bacterium ADurb.Bin340]